MIHARESGNGGFSSHGLTDAEAGFIRQRQLLYYRDEFGDRGEKVTVDPALFFPNPRLRSAYVALQAWKQAILSDPFNLTGDWVGSGVCKYTGVFCAPALDDRNVTVVAGVDLNHGDIAGYLPEELGLLEDLALFHINSNRFCGTVPHKFENLKLLFELDLSNNRFAGKFPGFNEFEGKVPRELFDKDLDAIFINHNRFSFDLPDNFGNSPVSVIVLANNHFKDHIINNGLRSCLPPEIGLLTSLTVLDVSHNELVGPLPASLGGMVRLEQLNVAHNLLSGKIPESICLLPHLQNFTYSYNFFTGEAPACLKLPAFDDRRNCFPGSPISVYTTPKSPPPHYDHPSPPPTPTYSPPPYVEPPHPPSPPHHSFYFTSPPPPPPPPPLPPRYAPPRTPVYHYTSPPPPSPPPRSPPPPPTPVYHYVPPPPPSPPPPSPPPPTPVYYYTSPRHLHRSTTMSRLHHHHHTTPTATATATATPPLHCEYPLPSRLRHPTTSPSRPRPSSTGGRTPVATHLRIPYASPPPPPFY
ncbi:unnamed protein product [Spirodela intermedia]|uniref:Cell wall hydroxyproline-rich glycoprotein n=1 Tax=Spirodela intermedia TaxID=51605 RepID=A0A7I8J872_SPIIN|nr:unnamed protein product [Spirodela intermedia]CAA6666274.1 unnamed protein product [Spirodela intermedia]